MHCAALQAAHEALSLLRRAWAEDMRMQHDMGHVSHGTQNRADASERRRLLPSSAACLPSSPYVCMYCRMLVQVDALVQKVLSQHGRLDSAASLVGMHH